MTMSQVDVELRSYGQQLIVIQVMTLIYEILSQYTAWLQLKKVNYRNKSVTLISMGHIGDFKELTVKVLPL